MTNANSNDELEIIKQLLIATANRTESNSESIERSNATIERINIVVERNSVAIERINAAVERNSAAIERLDEIVERNSVAIGRLDEIVERNSVAIDNLTVKLDQLADFVNQQAIDAEADRDLMVSMLENISNLQQQNQQILNYLFNQQSGNGK